MSENLQMGLNLIFIGMTVVFLILFLVVAGGNIMIIIVNRFYPQITTEIKGESDSGNNKLAVIVAAVDIVTSGKGKVEGIRRLN